MSFAFSKVGILKIPWMPFLVLSVIFFLWTIYQWNLQGFFLGLVAMVLFSAFWAFSGDAYVKIDNQLLEVRYGRVCQFQIPLPDIVDVQPVEHPWYYGLGIRCVRKGTYALVTDTNGVIEFTFKQPVAIRLNFIPVTLQAQGLRLSLVDAESFIQELRLRLEKSSGKR
jgi:hypothetical protein